MKREDVGRFFSELSKRWTIPTEILLLGGAGALVMGGNRPTMDVDFEVHIRSRAASWEAFARVVAGVSEKTGIGAQYAESIDRWSQIALGDYRRHTLPVSRFGSLKVRVLQPEHWSIGKIARYWDQDIQDMIAVFSRRRPDPAAVARVWAQAIARSPKSTQLALVRRQALHFFRTFGGQIWGPSFRSETVESQFRKL